jgi:hypothetical protein
MHSTQAGFDIEKLFEFLGGSGHGIEQQLLRLGNAFRIVLSIAHGHGDLL